MQTPEEFLESNGLATRSLDRAGLIAAFQKEMEAGLAGEPCLFLISVISVFERTVSFARPVA